MDLGFESARCLVPGRPSKCRRHPFLLATGSVDRIWEGDRSAARRTQMQERFGANWDNICAGKMVLRPRVNCTIRIAFYTLVRYRMI